MFERVIGLIQERERFLISGHVNPDGDCLGTQVALYHFLRGLGKEAEILNSHAPESSLDFLTKHTPFGVHRAGQALPEHDVHFLTDCSTLDRLGSIGTEAKKLEGKVRVVVDHHVGSDRGDGDLLLWDVEAPSAGAVVYDLYRKFGAPLSAAAAEGVFVSLVSDTGWFKYSNTSDDALAIAADLVALGLQPHLIFNAMYRRNKPESVQLLSEGLARCRYEHDGRVAVLPLDRAFMKRMEQHDFSSDELLDPPRSVEGVDVVLMLKELDRSKVKISLRASDRVNVDGVARSFGGGGHHKAAGAELDGSLEQCTERVLAELAKLLGVGE